METLKKGEQNTHRGFKPKEMAERDCVSTISTICTLQFSFSLHIAVNVRLTRKAKSITG